jgi:hypothetical protein
MNFTGRAELSRAVPSQSTIAKFHFNNRQYDWLGYARAQHSYFVFSVELLVLMDLDEVSKRIHLKQQPLFLFEGYPLAATNSFVLSCLWIKTKKEP